MTKLGVVLLSGGLDSTTVAVYAVKQGYELTALTLLYGQKHVREMQSATKVAEVLGIRHEVIDVCFFKELAWYSALTKPDYLRVPNARDEQVIEGGIPITYVPLRNTLFLTIAAAYLESQALRLIEDRGVDPQALEVSIFIAANVVDYSGYPDCRPEYYEAMRKVLCLGSKLGTQYGKAIGIETPIILKSKAEIVKLAVELDAPIEYTWSCYEGREIPCGTCDSCVLRAKGFAEAGYKDPITSEFTHDGRIGCQ